MSRTDQILAMVFYLAIAAMLPIAIIVHALS
jgi:hypothetical protein